ncbi:MAG TPA: secretin N-terminal domain-containing protein [Verrucomicrobiae bacterium]|jgi:general secretion pathway protein D
MKTIALALVFLLTALGAWAQPAPGRPNFPAFPSPPSVSRNPATPTPATQTPTTASPAAASSTAASDEVAGYSYKWEAVDINQVLDIYAGLVGRTLLRPSSLPASTVTLQTETPLTKDEAIEALQALLGMNGISIVNIGDKFAEVLPTDQANGAAEQFDTNASPNNLPELGSYVTRIVQLNYVKPSEVVPIIQPLAKVNSIIPIDNNGILVIRDYAQNVKRMLEMINMIDVSVPLEYTNEVIPIKYAQAQDIASVLNSLGGQGSATVTFGSSSAPGAVNGVGGGGRTGTSGFGGGGTGLGAGSTSQYNTQSGTSTPNGTPTTGSTFQQRLMNIINRSSPTGTPGATSSAGGGGPSAIQVFGQAKIIADERSNSLLVFATRQDMEAIKHVISQLDVLLSQVLIESVIVDYSLGPNTLSYGISAAQNPQTFSSNPQIIGGGGVNNGPSLLSFLGNSVTGLTNGASSLGTTFTGNTLPGGLSYFGNIGPHWDVALQAVQADSHATIVQRPSIMTSQAKPAQFFVGDTVPYINGTTYGGAYGNQSSYSQLSVGVELDVTPFINPEGLVVMDINQEIDALNGFTAITGVGNIPNTIKRTLSSEVAVHNRDAIMLGGFIENNKSTARSGIPLLMDIPLLGNLFTSRSDSKQREELIVMMRPTVMTTPEIAAQETTKEEQQLPGVTAAEMDDATEQQQLIRAEDKRLIREYGTNQDNGYLPTPVPEGVPNTNSASQ